MPNRIFSFYIPEANGPTKQPNPRNRFTIPMALLNFFKPTKSIKYIVVRQLIPAKKKRRVNKILI